MQRERVGRSQSEPPALCVQCPMIDRSSCLEKDEPGHMTLAQEVVGWWQCVPEVKGQDGSKTGETGGRFKMGVRDRDWGDRKREGVEMDRVAAGMSGRIRYRSVIIRIDNMLQYNTVTACNLWLSWCETIIFLLPKVLPPSFPRVLNGRAD